MPRTTGASPRLLPNPPHSPYSMIVQVRPLTGKLMWPANPHPREIRTWSRAAAPHPGTWAKGALVAAEGAPPHSTERGKTGSSEAETGEGMRQVVTAKSGLWSGVSPGPQSSRVPTAPPRP